jgi:hypothetical protein
MVTLHNRISQRQFVLFQFFIARSIRGINFSKYFFAVITNFKKNTIINVFLSCLELFQLIKLVMTLENRSLQI